MKYLASTKPQDPPDLHLNELVIRSCSRTKRVALAAQSSAAPYTWTCSEPVETIRPGPSRKKKMQVKKARREEAGSSRWTSRHVWNPISQESTLFLKDAATLHRASSQIVSAQPSASVRPLPSVPIQILAALQFRRNEWLTGKKEIESEGVVEAQ